MTVTVSRSPLRAAACLVAAASTLALAGCMGSPTYGTDKTANAQLLEDLSSSLTLGIGKREQEIAYQPRPDLVKPETTAVLPEPQDDITTASASGWPESPEQRRARIRAEATANQDNIAYRSTVVRDVVAEPPNELTPAQQREEFRRQRAMTSGADGSSRRVLSDPPLVYREPAATAPMGDLGIPEHRKDRDARRAAKKAKKNKTAQASSGGPIPPVVQ